jgi:hypothetical protein
MPANETMTKETSRAIRPEGRFDAAHIDATLR